MENKGIRTGKKGKIAGVTTFLFLFMVAAVLFVLTSCDNGMNLPPAPDDTPVANTISLASNGCCYTVDDIDVAIKTNQGSHSVLTLAQLNDRERHDAAITADMEDGPVDIEITFHYQYSESGTVTLDVLSFTSADALLENGVMLYFQERGGMFLLAVSGNDKVLFYLSENGWITVPLDFENYILASTS